MATLEILFFLVIKNDLYIKISSLKIQKITLGHRKRIQNIRLWENLKPVGEAAWKKSKCLNRFNLNGNIL